MLYTSLHQELRKINPNIQVTYDASSPLLGPKYGDLIVQYTHMPKRFAYRQLDMPQGGQFFKSQKRFPFQSPLGDRITMGDLCDNPPVYNSDGSKIIEGNKRYLNGLSAAMFMNHGLYVYLEGLYRAHRIWDMPISERVDYVPKHLSMSKEIIADVFETDKPFDLIDKYEVELRGAMNDASDRSISVMDPTYLDLSADNIDDFMEPSVMDELFGG